MAWIELIDDQVRPNVGATRLNLRRALNEANLPMTYAGVDLLLVAMIWNAWPRGAAGAKRDACPYCAPRGSASVNENRGVKELSS